MLHKLSTVALAGIVVFSLLFSLSYMRASAIEGEGQPQPDPAEAQLEGDPAVEPSEPGDSENAEEGGDSGGEVEGGGPEDPDEPGEPEEPGELEEPGESEEPDGTEDSGEPGEQALPPEKPLPYSGIPEHIYAGAEYSVVQNEDGFIWAWGRGDLGQLGGSAKKDSALPVRVEGLKDIRALSAGEAHGLAIDKGGFVFRWGGAPAQIPGLQNIQAVYAGGTGNLAVAKSGSVFLWQDSEEDDLANLPELTKTRYAALYENMAFAIDKSDCAWAFAIGGEEGGTAPVRILEDVNALSSAGGKLFLLKNDGTVWECGLNMEEGIVSDPGALSPKKIVGLGSIVSIAAQDGIFLALKEDGTVLARGGNGFASVPGLEGVREIAAGRSHCLALKEDGSVWGWGDNRHKAIGDFPEETISTPVLIIPGRAGTEKGNDDSVGFNNTSKLDAAKGRIYYLPLEGSGIRSFKGASLRVGYDKDVLRLLDAAAHLTGRLLDTGPDGGELAILSNTDGEVAFAFGKHIPPGKEWSGLITLLMFEALTDGETEVSVSWED